MTGRRAAHRPRIDVVAQPQEDRCAQRAILGPAVEGHFGDDPGFDPSRRAVELGLFEEAVSAVLSRRRLLISYYTRSKRSESERVLSPHRKPYATRDGYVGLMPYTSAHWKRFFEIAGRPEPRPA